MIAEAEPHVRALVAKLEAELPDSVAVGWGKAPGTVPSVAVYPDAGDVDAARLCGDRSRIVLRLIIHGVGAGPEQASWVSDKARIVLLGEPPSVAGRKVYRLTQVAGMPTQRDDEITPPLYVQAAQYRLMSEPA